MVQGLGFTVWGLEFRVRVWGLGIRVRVRGLWFGVWGLGFGAWGLGFRVRTCGLSSVPSCRVRSPAVRPDTKENSLAQYFGTLELKD
jgi:hypothetical protein